MTQWHTVKLKLLPPLGQPGDQRKRGGGHLLFRKERLTQGDPLTMISYGLRFISIIKELHAAQPQVTQLWYPDKAVPGGELYPHSGTLGWDSGAGTPTWVLPGANQEHLGRLQVQCLPVLSILQVYGTENTAGNPVPWGVHRVWRDIGKLFEGESAVLVRRNHDHGEGWRSNNHRWLEQA